MVNESCFTFDVVLGNVAVLVQDLLHAAQRDGCEMPGVLELQQALQVHGSLAPSQVNALAVLGIQPQKCKQTQLTPREFTANRTELLLSPPECLISVDEYS